MCLGVPAVPTRLRLSEHHICSAEERGLLELQSSLCLVERYGRLQKW